jgi:hypothetical protein
MPWLVDCFGMNASRQRLTPILSGVAGEYFVAAELSRRGCIASITLRNSRCIDIIAANQLGTRSVSIQVKTNQQAYKEWLLGKQAEIARGANYFYVFVNLNGLDGAPEYHVAESGIVAAECKRLHLEWLSSPKRDGSPRKDTAMRVFRDPENKYLGAWHRLGLT